MLFYDGLVVLTNCVAKAYKWLHSLPNPQEKKNKEFSFEKTKQKQSIIAF